MTAKQTAIKLVEEFEPYMTLNGKGPQVYAKECALAAINTLLGSKTGDEKTDYEVFFYNQVKKELLAL